MLQDIFFPAAGFKLRGVSAALVPVTLALIALSAASVLACEKHINGHQNGSDTHQETQAGSQQH